MPRTAGTMPDRPYGWPRPCTRARRAAHAGSRCTRAALSSRLRLPMIVSFAHAGARLLVQAGQVVQGAAPVLVRQVGNERGWFETATAVASGLMSVALLV